MMKEKIGNCFPYIKNGLNIKQDKNKGGIPITRIETLSNDRFNRDKMGYADIFDVEKYSDRILCDGDILMSHINSSRYLGRAVLYQKQNNENIIHGVNLLRLKADRSIVYPNYAAKFFASRYFKKQVVSITKKAVNQASFSIAALKELEIQLPDLDTQKRIAQNFEKISNCIFTLEEYLNKLDDLVKSRFVEMFGYIGEGTFIYPPKRIEDLCLEIIGGGTPSMKHPEYYGGSIPFIKSGDVKSQVVTNGNLSITKEGLKRSSAKLAPMHSILVVTRSGILKHTLPIAIAGCSVAINQDLKALVLNESVIPEYIQWSLLVSEQLILSKVRATTADNIETSLLKNFMVPVPPLQLQHEFADFAAQVDKLKFDFDFLVSFSIPSICLFCLKLDP